MRPGAASVALVVALAAGGVLVLGDDRNGRPAPPVGERVTAAVAWPRAQRSQLPATLPDGRFFQPALFVDAGTAVGTAPSTDGRWLRLLLRHPDGSVRQLHRLPSDDEPQYYNFAASGGEVVWTQTTTRSPMQIWAADVRSGTPARRLTADTGNAVFYGTQSDFVFDDGRVYWIAAPDTPGSDTPETTEIRSVPLAGGAVTTRTEAGLWALSTWPWLTDEAANLAAGTTRLRNLGTGREFEVRSAGLEAATCTPVWCRMMVMDDAGLVRIDVMHPDGSGRRRIAGGGAQAATADAVVLDRFAILSEPEPGPESDVTGIAGLVVHDISTGRTVDISPAATGAVTRNGVLWWSTGIDETAIWHTVDLRTV